MTIEQTTPSESDIGLSFYRIQQWLNRNPDGGAEPIHPADLRNILSYQGRPAAPDQQGQNGWRPITEHDGSADPVDLWVEGERRCDFIWNKGRWERTHGYPAVTTVLMRPPSHFMTVPTAPEVEGC